MVFYLSIVCYIASVIIALALMIIGTKMTTAKFLVLCGLHGLTLLLFVLFSILRNETDPISSPNFTFMLYICSGVCLTGLVWRISIPLLLRVYLSIFALTFPLFIFSPSMLVNFLLTTHYTDTLGKTFQVNGAHFLEQQNSWSHASATLKYKLIVKKGIFHQTLARDLDFGGPLDSIHTLSFEVGKKAQIRGYRHQETFVSTGIDSIELTVPMINRKVNQLERKLTP